MTDRLTLENELRDALIAALGISYPLERIVDDLAISRPEIVAAVRFNRAVQLDATQLIRVCWEFDTGLASLREVALAALKGRRGLPRLSKAFQECLAAQVEESGLDSFPQGKIACPPLQQSLQADRKGDEISQQAEPAVHPAQEVYISYAWGDETPQGKQRQELVEKLCASLGKQGVKVRRDSTQIQPGDRIRDYMQRLARGDVILVVLSDRYLRSEACMAELYWIWDNARQKPDRFLGRVIPLTLPDAQLRHTADRFARAEHWQEVSKDLEARMSRHFAAVGERTVAQCRLIKEIAAHTSDMLELLVDKFEPRDFERQAQEEFKEVLDQIQALYPSKGSPTLDD